MNERRRELYASAEWLVVQNLDDGSVYISDQVNLNDPRFVVVPAEVFQKAVERAEMNL